MMDHKYLFLIVILCLIGANYSYLKAKYTQFIHWANTTRYRAEAVSIVVAAHVLAVYFVVVILAY